MNNNFTAKKSLGQNFLHAPQIISAMVKESKAKSGSKILEVGPGKGALTKVLLETGAKVIAVEKDERAIAFLSEKFKQEIRDGQLKLVNNDILEFNHASYGLKDKEYSIVANIPYYISGEFLRKFLESDDQPSKIVVMLQKELAKRIIDEKESVLSISIKAYGEPVYLVSVPRKFFRPIPNVDSAVLSIDNISKSFFSTNKIDEKSFFATVKAGFAHKRKVLIKNLEILLRKDEKDRLKELWENEGWSPTARAEEFKLDSWKKITIYISCFPQK